MVNAPQLYVGLAFAIPAIGEPEQIIGSHLYICPLAGFVDKFVVSKTLDAIGAAPVPFNE